MNRVSGESAESTADQEGPELILHLILVVDDQTKSMVDLFRTLAGHTTRIVGLRFDPCKSHGTGTMNVKLFARGDAKQLLSALLREPVVREATVFKSLISKSPDPV
jgi:hypothetical protein